MSNSAGLRYNYPFRQRGATYSIKVYKFKAEYNDGETKLFTTKDEVYFNHIWLAFSRKYC